METPEKLFIFLFLPSFLLSPASAVSITFNDLNLASNQQIAIYDPTLPANESLIGTYNATDSVILPDGGAYVAVLRPGPQHWFQNPLNAIKLFEISLPPAMAYILFFAALVGSIAVVFRIFK